ncbi:MAG: sugar phosphate isomerase/epimerase [Lentisphaeria bacterium]|nr:sugar phosphate isomerase/epimerase [Lentisphaeria bacterium]
MKIGALSSSLRKPFPVMLATYAEMGLKGIQILAEPEFLVADSARLAQYKKMCDDHGLEVSAVCGDVCRTHFSVELEWQDRVRVHAHVVDLAEKLGSHIITTHIGVVPEDPNDPVYEMLAKSLKAAADYSASRGAVLAVETGPEKAETLRRILDDIDSPGIGVNLDPANLRMVACVDAAHAVQVLGKYIVHTHAKDGVNLVPGSPAATYGIVEVDGSKRKFAEPRSQYKEVPLGEGQVEWDPYLAALKNAGFDGFLTIERECGEDPEGDIRKAYNFLKGKIS